MASIFLVRHGQASLGAVNYDELSGVGAEQARLLGAWWARIHQRFDIVAAGRMRRHLQTAEACLSKMPGDSGRNNAVRFDSGFNEYDLYDVLGGVEPALRQPEELSAMLASSTDGAQRAFHRIFSVAFDRWVGGLHNDDYLETWHEFRVRCVKALSTIADDCVSGASAVVFTSGGPITAICQHLLGVPDKQIADLHFPLCNASVTKLICQPGRVSLSYFNSSAHLDIAGYGNVFTYR